MTYPLKLYNKDRRFGEQKFIAPVAKGPRSRLQQRWRQLAEIKRSQQAVCLASHCVVVELPLAVVLEIGREAYGRSHDYPFLTSPLMLVAWY